MRPETRFIGHGSGLLRGCGGAIDRGDELGDGGTVGRSGGFGNSSGAGVAVSHMVVVMVAPATVMVVGGRQVLWREF